MSDDEIFSLNIRDVEQEYQSLYEKLSKAEEFYDEWYLKIGHTIHEEEYQQLKQNQKTPEDIKKISVLDDLVQASVTSILTDEPEKEIVNNLKRLLDNAVKITELEKEIQQLKEDLHKSLDSFCIVKQDSKNNAEIVEKIKDELKNPAYSIHLKLLRKESEKRGLTEVEIQERNYLEIIDKLQSILKESK